MLLHSRGFAQYSTILNAESRVANVEMQYYADVCVEALSHGGFSADTLPFRESKARQLHGAKSADAQAVRDANPDFSSWRSSPEMGGERGDAPPPRRGHR